jgi:histidinol-phosphate/aromatic aminotransferase/cobyric acid decarboxylase-like protein
LTGRRPALRAAVPAAGLHGGDAPRVAAALGLDPAGVLDLSASMNPFAPDVQAIAAAELGRDGSLALTAYPDATAATAALAAAMEVDAGRLVLTNGGAEAIALVAAELGAGSVVEPEFSLYRRHLAHVDAGAPRWRSNPSNPLGRLAAKDDEAAVWDEAFYPLATGRWTRGDDRSWRLGSLTKLWNCPGLRLGYAVAPDVAAASRIRAAQPQWAVNGLALAVLPTLLALTDLTEWSGLIAGLRRRFVGALRQLAFDVGDTDATWVLVERPGLRADLAPLGVVVRDCSSFGLPGVHRVAVPTPTAFDRAVAAFTAIAEP